MVAILGASISSSHGEITSLPGYSGQLRSKHYGGYITVDEKNDRNLYYYLVCWRREVSSVLMRQNTLSWWW